MSWGRGHQEVFRRRQQAKYWYRQIGLLYQKTPKRLPNTPRSLRCIVKPPNGPLLNKKPESPIKDAKKPAATKAEIPQKNPKKAESLQKSAKTSQKGWKPDAPSSKDSTSFNGARYGKIFLDIYIS